MTPEHAARTFFNQIHPLTETEWQAALPYFRFPTFQTGEMLFEAGGFDKHIYFVLDGLGRYFYLDIDGNETNKSIVRRGGGFGSLTTCLDDQPSPFSTQALTDLRTVAISYADFIVLSEQHLSWATIIRRILERLVIKKEKRESSLLQLSARQRYEQFLEEFGDDANLIKLKQVALYLGITDVSLSRLRKEMGLTTK